VKQKEAADIVTPPLEQYINPETQPGLGYAFGITKPYASADYYSPMGINETDILDAIKRWIQENESSMLMLKRAGESADTAVLGTYLANLEKPKETERNKALNAMSNEFVTSRFVTFVTESLGKSERTAKYWLKKMVKRGQLIKKDHGYYEKVQLV